MNIGTTEVGWGPLGVDLQRVTELFVQKRRTEEAMQSANQTLLEAVGRLNTARRKRVLDLIDAEGRAICLLHKRIFKESSPADWLAPKDGVFLVRMVQSWRESHRVYDGDPDYTDESSQYDTTVCQMCKDLLSNAQFTWRDRPDSRMCTHTMVRGGKPEADTIESLYTLDVVDVLSEGYYLMPKVTMESLALL